MFRKIGFGAAAALTVGLLAVGCSEDGDTIIQGGGSATTDNFPGSQIQTNNTADDGRAWSPPDQDINQDLRVFWNVSNGQAIALYTADDETNDNVNLFAQYFNGSTWGPPIQIFGRDRANGVFEDSSSSVGGFKVCWINTASTSGNVPEVAARNGDAVILFTRNDEDPNAGFSVATEEDQNLRLWMTYFDVSAASAAASGTVRGGFNTEAVTVDDEVIFTASVQDPPVSAFGFVSNSLACSHEFTGGIDSVDSGQPTSFLNIVYAKQESSTTGVRFLAKAVLGDAPDNDLNTLLDAEETLSPALSIQTADSVVGDQFVVHNDLMFWQAVVSSGTEPNETFVTVTRFDEDGAVEQELLGPTPIDNDGSDVVNLPSAANIYGGDHNLESTDVVFTVTGFVQDAVSPADGDNANDTDLYVARIDNDATLAVEFVQVDAFADTIDSVAPTQVARNISNVQTRMNRPGTNIFVLFNQANTDVGNDGTNTVLVNDLLYVTVIQTRPTAPAAGTGVTPDRDIDVSVYDDDAATTGIYEPLVAGSLVSTGNATTGTQEDNVTNAQFQVELVVGQADSQLDDDVNASCNRGCAFQSDVNQVNFTYEQMVDPQAAATAGSDEQRLYVEGVEVTNNDTTSPDLTLVGGTAGGDVIATRDIDYGPSFNAVAADRGDQTRDNTGAATGDSGSVLVFYQLNANNPTDNSVTGSFGETRAFVYDQATGEDELLSTDDVREFGQVSEGFEVITVPANENVSSSPAHAGTTLHVLFVENEDNGPSQRIATRSYDKGTINDNATANDALENRFTPNLVGGTTPADPVFIDAPTEGALFDLNGPGLVVLRNGSTVGAYFDESDTLYYTDTNGSALQWDSELGVSAPQVVDNDVVRGIGNFSNVTQWEVFAAPNCNNLSKSMVFWGRNDNFVQERYLVRVHN